MTLPTLSVASTGVSVAVHVLLSTVLRPLSTPLPTLKSPVVRPDTASLKVRVICADSPALMAMSSTLKPVTEGRRVSTACWTDSGSALRLPERSATAPAATLTVIAPSKSPCGVTSRL